ncbi:MAG: hypothetical protein EON88_01740 [Brevundimonas sp.]|nr:MAG: hypothetical protein EON88_01740 [Brevundimonas sp.]
MTVDGKPDWLPPQLAPGDAQSVPGAAVAQDRTSPAPPLATRVRAIAYEVARAQTLADRAFAVRCDRLGSAPRAFRIAETTVSFDLATDDLRQVADLAGLLLPDGLVLAARIADGGSDRPFRLTLLLTPTLPEDRS